MVLTRSTKGLDKIVLDAMSAHTNIPVKSYGKRREMESFLIRLNETNFELDDLAAWRLYGEFRPELRGLIVNVIEDLFGAGDSVKFYTPWETEKWVLEDNLKFLRSILRLSIKVDMLYDGVDNDVLVHNVVANFSSISHKVLSDHKDGTLYGYELLRKLRDYLMDNRRTFMQNVMVLERMLTSSPSTHEELQRLVSICYGTSSVVVDALIASNTPVNYVIAVGLDDTLINRPEFRRTLCQMDVSDAWEIRANEKGVLVGAWSTLNMMSEILFKDRSWKGLYILEILKRPNVEDKVEDNVNTGLRIWLTRAYGSVFSIDDIDRAMRYFDMYVGGVNWYYDNDPGFSMLYLNPNPLLKQIRQLKGGKVLTRSHPNYDKIVKYEIMLGRLADLAVARNVPFNIQECFTDIFYSMLRISPGDSRLSVFDKLREYRKCFPVDYTPVQTHP